LKKVLVVGGGFAGCVAAERLAIGGASVFLADSAPEIGGKVRRYGCKADAKCNDCGVCLASGLWRRVAQNPSIDVTTSASVTDFRSDGSSRSALLSTPDGERCIDALDCALIATGFESVSASRSAHLHIEGGGVVTGTELESAMRGLGRHGVFETPPSKVAFIQCFGSRDEKERSNYCSRVCCSYSTRMARVIMHCYPECRVTFFYMELQSVANSDAFAALSAMGARFVKCRPVKISGSPAAVEYDDPSRGRVREDFDIVVLSEGIHPARDNWRTSEIFGIERDCNGFLRGGRRVYVAGTSRRPMTIAETHQDATAVADAILAELGGNP
jgi:heterodisulfide reductase subunit A